MNSSCFSFDSVSSIPASFASSEPYPLPPGVLLPVSFSLIFITFDS